MTSASSQDLSQTDPHWALKYIGRPWVQGAQGPNEFDCWGFVRFVNLHEFGIDVPIIDTDANDMRAVIKSFTSDGERANWSPVTTPKTGDAVLMAHCKYPSHVGIWLDVDGGGVLHCIRGEGVVFSSLSSLKTCGWGRVEYYRHASNA